MEEQKGKIKDMALAALARVMDAGDPITGYRTVAFTGDMIRVSSYCSRGDLLHYLDQTLNELSEEDPLGFTLLMMECAKIMRKTKEPENPQ